MRFLQLLFIFVSLLSFSSCEVTSDVCVDAIRLYVATFIFEGSPPAAYWARICSNNHGVLSVWAAAKRYCTQDEIDAGNRFLSGICLAYGPFTLVSYQESLPLLTDEFIAALPVVDLLDVEAKNVWNTSVLISPSFYESGRKTAVCRVDIAVDTFH